MTRIRYNKTADGFLVSKIEVLLPTGESVKIHLNTNGNSYQFINSANNSVLSDGTAANLLALKKLVRNTLLELGVPLEVEVKTFKKSTEVAA